MNRATKVFPSGRWSHVATDTVVLDFENRHRRRIRMRGDGGLEFLLDLPETTALRNGDGLLLEDGRIVEVKAADEPLSEVAVHDPSELARLAWHLGNRHLPVQFSDDRLLVARDHVIDEMLRSLGAHVKHVDAPFDPEGGAYATGPHGHHHNHDG